MISQWFTPNNHWFLLVWTNKRPLTDNDSYPTGSLATKGTRKQISIIGTNNNRVFNHYYLLGSHDNVMKQNPKENVRLNFRNVYFEFWYDSKRGRLIPEWSMTGPFSGQGHPRETTDSQYFGVVIKYHHETETNL